VNEEALAHWGLSRQDHTNKQGLMELALIGLMKKTNTTARVVLGVCLMLTVW